MALYCGIDLHSNNSYVAVIDESFKKVAEGRQPNDMAAVLGMLAPYQEELEGVVVESTWNWYWLVDGLKEAGYGVHLGNTWANRQYDGLKYADDRHDARWLARLLAMGILEEGYIYPKEERPLRDLLRRRGFLVKKRTSLLLAMGGAIACHTAARVKTDDLRKLSPQDVEALVGDPRVALAISSQLEPVKAMDVQILRLEKAVLAEARLRDEFCPLLTVWGIGKVLALTIMYEVGQISRFAKVGNFASYCRCVKSERISNAKRKGRGNSKNGNPYLSWSFTEASHFAVRHHPVAQRYFQRKRAKTNGIVANRALAHKLARASYYVMRDQVDFDPAKVFG